MTSDSDTHGLHNRSFRRAVPLRDDYPEEEWLDLSGIQHFSYCPRQWALIHIEKQWADNFFTADGQVRHARVNDPSQTELRGDVLSVRALRVSSPSLGITGICDVVEFYANPDGAVLNGRPGRWIPYPVEYKRGKSKSIDADRLQLCCEALCLEEMLGVDCPEGALFYEQTHRREKVAIDRQLRDKTREDLARMHRLYERGWTPRVRQSSKCRNCSLRDICLPELTKRQSVSTYMDKALRTLEDDRA